MAVRDIHLGPVSSYEDGQSFGSVGAYRLRRGTAQFAVDPSAAPNAGIVDLVLASRNADGTVGFESDFCVLEPESAERANGLLLFVVANRGRMNALPFSEDLSWPPREDRIDPGDGFLLEQGWTIAWCGWQFDVPRGTALGLSTPEALAAGAPIPGQVRVDFRSDVASPDHSLSDSGPLYTFKSYPATDTEENDAVLTVRDYLNGPRQPIERDRWCFAHDDHGAPIPDDESIWLDGGFEPFRIYEVLYTTRACPVVGTGLLAVRDFVSYLRRTDANDRQVLGRSVDHAFAFGASQSGRFIRHFLNLGLNRDEGGSSVFDGVLPHIAGGRLGEFNQRYGQPSHFSYSGIGGQPPFSPSPGMGLFDEQRRIGSMPKVVITNSAWEYWRGDAALNHIDPRVPIDLPEAPEVRLYFLAGTDHLGASPLKDAMPVMNPVNRLSPIVLLRAAFMNLVRWVLDGTEPPASRLPRLDDGSAATRAAVLETFRSIPGAALPDVAALPLTYLVNYGPNVDSGIINWPGVEGPALDCYVGAVNEDGNETAGVRLPDLQVPIATFTGWNPRARQEGLPDALYEFPGSMFAFPESNEEGTRTVDPRRSVVERYAGHADYMAQIRSVVDELVSQRLLLPGDAARAIASAGRTFNFQS